MNAADWTLAFFEPIRPLVESGEDVDVVPIMQGLAAMVAGMVKATDHPERVLGVFSASLEACLNMDTKRTVN